MPEQSDKTFPSSTLSPMEQMLHFPVGTKWRDCFNGWVEVTSHLCYQDSSVEGYTADGVSVTYTMGYCMDMVYPNVSE